LIIRRHWARASRLTFIFHYFLFVFMSIIDDYVKKLNRLTCLEQEEQKYLLAIRAEIQFTNHSRFSGNASGLPIHTALHSPCQARRLEIDLKEAEF
jgi:hypothetical protein